MMRPHPRVVRGFLLIAVPVVLVLAAGVLWLRGGRSVSTENAYVKAHIAQVAPEISGRVAEVLVRDHMAVTAGQLLVRIDPAPFQLARDKAAAELDAARIAVETMRATWVETRSELAEVEAQAEYLSRQASRQQTLADRAVASVTKLDEAQNAAQVARFRITVVKRRLERVLASLAGNPQLPTEQHPLVRERQAELERAELELARTAITAPIAGNAVAVKLQPGDQLKAATPVFAVIADTRPWVEANMKETDLTHVVVGQKATVVLDIYPDTAWAAEVMSISPATGAEFAILPPQNASGNWVKVVQRLPVRVRLLPYDGEPPLRAGMTATVTIDIGRERSLAGLFGGSAAALPRAQP
ncbi:MAG: HlyD family secretion protein [Proteobacteria bacterium]|nr:HlyD family secretion protein [Pseudomonadota bacterium]